MRNKTNWLMGWNVILSVVVCVLTLQVFFSKETSVQKVIVTKPIETASSKAKAKTEKDFQAKKKNDPVILANKPSTSPVEKKNSEVKNIITQKPKTIAKNMKQDKGTEVVESSKDTELLPDGTERIESYISTNKSITIYQDDESGDISLINDDPTMAYKPIVLTVTTSSGKTYDKTFIVPPVVE